MATERNAAAATTAILPLCDPSLPTSLLFAPRVAVSRPVSVRSVIPRCKLSAIKTALITALTYIGRRACVAFSSSPAHNGAREEMHACAHQIGASCPERAAIFPLDLSSAAKRVADTRRTATVGFPAHAQAEHVPFATRSAAAFPSRFLDASR